MSIEDLVPRPFYVAAAIGSALALAALLALSISCSSAPKPPDGVFDARNKAAELAKLGDGFMAKAQYASALQYYGEALKAGSAVDDLVGVAASHASMGRAYLAAGEVDAAGAEYETALEYGRYAGSPSAQSAAKAGMGEIAFSRGALTDALAAFEEAAALAGAAKNGRPSPSRSTTQRSPRRPWGEGAKR